MVRVASWNVFHGRAQRPVRRDLLLDFATALEAADWDVCGLQELPPWWARPLAESCGASLRVSRTSYARGVLPAVQRCASAGDPERLGARGAAVNALLVRPSAGRIIAHRTATLRWLPQRRTVHGVRLQQPGGDSLWVCNVHTHNRPAAAAAADLRLALDHTARWASGTEATGEPGIRGGRGGASVVVLGDLNLPAEQVRGIARTAGLAYLAGERVDHVLGSPGTALAASARALRPRTLDDVAALSDHRLLLAHVALPG